VTDANSRRLMVSVAESPTNTPRSSPRRDQPLWTMFRPALARVLRGPIFQYLVRLRKILHVQSQLLEELQPSLTSPCAGSADPISADAKPLFIDCRLQKQVSRCDAIWPRSTRIKIPWSKSHRTTNRFSGMYGVGNPRRTHDLSEYHCLRLMRVDKFSLTVFLGVRIPILYSRDQPADARCPTLSEP
jgi:hypothetical protein